MSPEEFDNRLRSSFQEEYLPPKENLWVNISEKLDQKARKPIWYWLLPVVIAVTVCVVWLSESLTGTEKQQEIAVVTEPNSVNPSLSEQNKNNAPAPVSTNSDTPESSISAATDENVAANNAENSVAETNQAKNNPVDNGVSSINNKPNPVVQRPIAGNPKPFADAGYPFANTGRSDRNSYGKTPKPSTANGIPLIGNPALANSLNEDLISTYLKYLSMQKFKPSSLLLEQYAYADIPQTEKPEKTNDPKVTKATKSKNTADLSARRWVNFGLGPQLALNSIQINSDSQAWVHRHLWDNKYKMTNDGIGFQGFAHFGYKFGKNNRFNFETGLNYSLRTENIRMNESSYDIPVRYNNGRIDSYIQILLKVIIYNPNTSTYDTTYYLAVDNFSLAVNNKYQVYTVPVRFNSEHKITDNTFFSVGIGGGFSMIRSKRSEHLDMRKNVVRKQEKSTQFSSSLSATLALYTNFNDIGQIGIYTGFQTYMNPWKVNSNQYAIKMSDAQFGLTFRKPLY